MTEQSNTMRPLALPGVRIGLDNTYDVRNFIPGEGASKSRCGMAKTCGTWMDTRS